MATIDINHRCKRLAHNFFGKLDDTACKSEIAEGVDKSGPFVDLSGERESRGKGRRRLRRKHSEDGDWGYEKDTKRKRVRKSRSKGGRVRKKGAQVPCLICSTSLTLDERKNHPYMNDEAEGIISTFVKLMMTKTDKDVVMEGDGTGQLKFDRALRLLGSRTWSSFLCGTCCVAVHRFIKLFEIVKGVQEQLFTLQERLLNMRAKFMGAVKLSEYFMSSSDVDVESLGCNRKVLFLTNAVNFLRQCFLNGGCPPEVKEVKTLKRRRQRVTHKIVLDTEAVLDDLISAVEEMEALEKSRPFSGIQQEKVSSIPELKREVPVASDDYNFDHADMPDLEMFSTMDDHFDDSIDRSPADSSSSTEGADPQNETPELTPKLEKLKPTTSKVADDPVLLATLERRKERKKQKDLQIRGKRKKKGFCAKFLNSIKLPTDQEFQELLKEEYPFRKDNWAKIKAKYPGITQKQYRDLLQEQIVKRQACSKDGIPGRAAVGRKIAFRVPTKKVEEDGKTKFIFKNVEIKKLEDGMFACGICGDQRKYKDVSYCKTHINMRHIDLSKGFACEICGRKFYYHGRLTQHLQLKHHIGGKLQCEICGELFSNPSTRYQHKKIVHEGVKPHVCEYCGRSFGTRKDKTIHVRRHTGEKPFICHVCPAAFVCKPTLKAHIRKRHPEAANDDIPSSSASTNAIAGI